MPIELLIDFIISSYKNYFKALEMKSWTLKLVLILPIR